LELLRGFAAALAPDARDLKLLVQVDVAPGFAVPRDWQRDFPTPWHWAFNKGVGIEAGLEESGVPAANLGISVQQAESARAAGVAIFLNPPDVTLAK
jgi:hypothetical protein